MAEEKQEKPRGSCLGKLVALITFAGVVGLGAAVFFIARPQDLSDIKGVGPASSVNGGKARDLKTVLKNAVDRGYAVTLTEEEINLYLKQTLTAKQGGLLEKAVTIEGVRVRLENERAEIIIERSIMGRPMTVSMYVRVIQELDVQGRTKTSVLRDGGAYLPDVPRFERLVKGGRFGQLVIPQGFLLLVLPSFEKLAKAYETELHQGFEEMSRITLSDGKLILDPRADGGSALPHPGETF
jgi:hypothetical protein